ncbi:amidohydrolase [Suttonella indologenes]|uniref:Indole-3-acetyl-aspartic acid hydrolase n=1 Tax=Suttonella indologenes TaxID=13276 RepID=A0A380MJ58_9GAMM|nr:amidohydrolase [Suttonella indologenes]SUO92386.1 Indole-3-acetyl-aspartic acid hydrolase [Suttonella indologenes]
MNDNLKQQLIAWRRDFHRHPEQGFLEMRTASRIAAELHQLGYALRLGREVMREDAIMGKPDAATTAAHAEWALANGAQPEFFAHFKDGFTAVVAELDTGKSGPTTAFRVDMDALPILESSEAAHRPQQLGFRSIKEGSMHACAHDGHSAMGLALAHLIMQNKDRLCGKLRLIFQPAEEGVRGAKSMVEAGVVDDADYFIAVHLGTGVAHRHFVAASSGFLATSKLDVQFKGVAAHAGAAPQEGKNALLAAATAALNLHAISRHSAGASRINVGELHAGNGRNIIANHASLKIETRGADAEVNDYVEAQARRIIAAAADMYALEYDIRLVGSSIHCQPSPALAKRLAALATQSPHFSHVIEEESSSLGSEDAAYFVQRVQDRGGEASYCIVGTELAAGHHHERFDIHEDSLIAGVDILFRAACDINALKYSTLTSK